MKCRLDTVEIKNQPEVVNLRLRFKRLPGVFPMKPLALQGRFLREYTGAALFVLTVNYPTRGWVLILVGIDSVTWDNGGINLLNVWDCCGNM